MLPGCIEPGEGVLSGEDTPPPPDDPSPSSSTELDPGLEPPTTPEGCGDEPEARWEAPGLEDLEAFRWGVQVTEATSGGALVSARSAVLGPLALHLAKACQGGWEELAPIEGLEPSDEGVVQHELEGLDPDSVYNLALVEQDGELRSQVGRFRTAIAPSASRVIRFGASSCLGGNDKPWPSLSRASEERLDFFLLGGDTIYADGADSLDEFRSHWRDSLEQEGLRDLSASTSLIATWDDHELTNNWDWGASGRPDRFSAAIEAFGESLPWRPGPGGTGLWRRLSWGRTLDVFVLDCRGERQDGHYISPEQMDWLKEELASSQARFKVILNSVPITDMSPLMASIEAQDRWQGHPEQRSEILEFISDTMIEGVLWVSGDFHYGQVATVDEPGGVADDQWEVLAGPGGSFINPLPAIFEATPFYDAVKDQFVDFIHTWTYCWFEADPEAGTILVRHIDDDGEVVNERLLQL